MLEMCCGHEVRVVSSSIHIEMQAESIIPVGTFLCLNNCVSFNTDRYNICVEIGVLMFRVNDCCFLEYMFEHVAFAFKF